MVWLWAKRERTKETINCLIDFGPVLNLNGNFQIVGCHGVKHKPKQQQNKMPVRGVPTNMASMDEEAR